LTRNDWNGASALIAPFNRLLLHGLQAAWIGVGLVVLLSYGILAVGHLKDRYQVNFVSGVYAGLAAHLNEGTFYPDLYDGGHYGGTRYMPLHFLLHAGVARMTGEYLVSGKLIAYTLTVCLVLELLIILRRQGCSLGIALALLSLVFISRAGFLACLTIRGDLLPAVLQLAALMLVEKNATARRVIWAALLCTLAVFTKMSAGWAPVAIGWYLIGRQRRLCGVFFLTWIGTLLLCLAALHGATSGRWLANVQMFSAAGIERTGPILAPIVLLYRISFNGPLFGLLLPLLILECVYAARQHSLTIYHRALFCCLPILLLIYADVGADHNHLLDLIVLAVPVLGSLWGRLTQTGETTTGLRGALALGLCWVVFMSWSDLMDNAVRAILLQGDSAASLIAKPLAGRLREDVPILSEDPWIDLARGRIPLVLDPFSISRMSKNRPELTASLQQRVEKGEFACIVMTRRIDRSNTLDRTAWEDTIFGRSIIDAIRLNYHLSAQAEGYYLYVPNTLAARTIGSDQPVLLHDLSRS
jgi:hypothetical protein